MSPDIKAVIFDLDGLMLDTEAVAQVAWEQTGREYGYDIPLEVHQQVIGLTVEKSAEVMKGIYGPDFPYDRLRLRRIELGEAYYREHGMPVKPGLTELLDFLEDRQIPKGVATSSKRDYAALKLNMAGIAGRFLCVISGDDIIQGKPAPDIFLKAAAAIPAKPETCLVLEDSDAGIRAAHAAGMIPVMIPDLKPPGEAIAKRVYRIFPSLHEVRGWLGDVLE